jgi:hypothetical protein
MNGKRNRRISPLVAAAVYRPRGLDSALDWQPRELPDARSMGRCSSHVCFFVWIHKNGIR